MNPGFLRSKGTELFSSTPPNPAFGVHNRPWVAFFLLLFLSAIAGDLHASAEKQTSPGPAIYDPSGQPKYFSAAELKALATKPSASADSISGELVVPIVKILEQMNATDTKRIEFHGATGERLEFSVADMRSQRIPLALSTTFHEGWKLVKMDARSGSKKPGNFYLRSVKQIYLFDSASEKKASVATHANEKGCANRYVYVDLAEALKEKEKVCILNLSGQNLKQLPAEISEFPLLQELYLGRNQLSSLPPTIRSLGQLRILAIGRNELKTLPKEIAHLNELRVFKLGRNQINTLPKEIGAVKKLEKLELDNNHLTSIPAEIGDLKNLKELELANNKISSLPPTLVRLKKMKELEIEGNPISDKERARLQQSLPGVEIE